ncbi:MAG: hypothetical protein QXJ39_01645 [Candidatus Korarchaeum sp.]
MRARGSAESRTISLLKLTQDFVIGLSASLSSGLEAIGCYQQVAVEGVSASETVYRRLGRMRKYLAGLLEGGDERASSEVAMKLLSRLYEIDLESRQRWIQLSVSLAITLSLTASLLSFYHLHLDPLLPLTLLPLYFLLPSFTPLEIPDPASAEAIASDLELGSGIIYALRHLGIYERTVVDEEPKVPTYFEYAMRIASRDAAASLMRRTANMLKDLGSIVDSWRAGMKALRKLLIFLVALSAGINLAVYVVSGKVFGEAPLGFLFTSGLVSSLLASKPMNCPVESALAYTTVFTIGKMILGI